MGARRRFALAALFVALCLLGTWTVSADGYDAYLPFITRGAVIPAPALPVAVLGPLSGPIAPFVTAHRDGALMAAAEWKARGGVLGLEPRLILADTQCDATVAAAAVRQAVEQEGARFIMGAVCSSASIPISDYANASGVLQVAAVSTSPRVTVDEGGAVKPYVFRTCFTEAFQGRVMARLAEQNLGAQTAAVVWQLDSRYSETLAESFREDFQARGGSVAVWSGVTAEELDFTDILDQVEAADADVLFVPAFYSTVNSLASQAKLHGIRATLMGGHSWNTPLLDLQAVDGGYFCNHFSPDDPNPAVQGFVQSYQQRYGTVPDATAALSYDAMNLLLRSIENAGVADPRIVKDLIYSRAHEAVTGTITFDASHNPVKNAAILHVEDGQVTFETSLRP